MGGTPERFPASWDEALGLARNSKDFAIDLLLLDVVLSTFNGINLANKIQEMRPGIPTVLMSDYPLDALENLGFLPSLEHFISKPFTSEILLSKLRSLSMNSRVARHHYLLSEAST